jgi:hypothetical protein
MPNGGRVLLVSSGTALGAFPSSDPSRSDAPFWRLYRRQACDLADGAQRQRHRRGARAWLVRELGPYAALWLANGAWSGDDDPLAHAQREQPAADFAADVLARGAGKSSGSWMTSKG